MRKPLDRRYGAQVARLLPVVILLKPFSNVFIAWGTRQFPESFSAHPVLLLAAVLNPWIIAGVTMQVVWLLTRMRLLSIADLSYVLPVTAIGYAISTLLGWWLLHEQISTARWLGTILITVGTAYVAWVPPAMTPVADSGRGSQPE